MKVLILANAASGLLCFRRELVETLVQKHEVVFCVPDAPQVSDIVALGARFVDCPFLDRRGTNPVRDMRLLKFYEDLVKTEKPSVVLTYTIKPNSYGGMASAKLGVPYIANVTGLGTAIESDGPLRSIALKLYRRGLRDAQMVFFQNRPNMEFMLGRGIVSGQCDLLPGSGVNLECFPALPYPDDDTIHLVFISRVMEQKGIEQFLDAADAIAPRHPEVRFHVFGAREGGYKGRLDNCVARGTVDYHGRTENVAAVHTFSSCTVHPSFYPEGMSNVLLESCACARPIITTGRPGCGEIVEDGINGFVVRERDSEDVIEKIEKLLCLSLHEREAMGLAGRAKVEREFDRRIVVNRYLREIEAISA